MTSRSSAADCTDKDPRPTRPADPRSRAVIAIVPRKSGRVDLHLECGHVARRRLGLCPPTRVICTECER